MKSGVVPQQPPRTVTPARTSGSRASQYSSTPTEYVVTPSTTEGRPALACTMTGRRDHGIMRMTSGATSAGPREQLMPMTSAPRADSVTAATSGVVPRNVRPSSPKVIVQKTGRSEFSRQASTAALASSRSAMVSTMKRSAPASVAAMACSANRS